MSPLADLDDKSFFFFYFLSVANKCFYPSISQVSLSKTSYSCIFLTNFPSSCSLKKLYLHRL